MEEQSILAHVRLIPPRPGTRPLSRVPRPGKFVCHSAIRAACCRYARLVWRTAAGVQFRAALRFVWNVWQSHVVRVQAVGACVGRWLGRTTSSVWATWSGLMLRLRGLDALAMRVSAIKARRVIKCWHEHVVTFLQFACPCALIAQVTKLRHWFVCSVCRPI